MDINCVFCGIIDNKIPAKIEYEDDFAVAFADIHPLAPIHYLMIPKKHIISLDETSETEILGKLQIALGKLIKKLNLKNYKIVVNGGSFQDVKHLHYHLLSGFTDPDKNF